MFRKSLAIMAACFLSISSVQAFSFGWSDHHQNEVKRDVLTLYASLYLMSWNAGVAASAASDEGPQSKGAVNAANDASGFNSIRLSGHNAGRAGSRNRIEPWWCESELTRLNVCAFGLASTINGNTEATAAAGSVFKPEFREKTIEAAVNMAQAGSDGLQIGQEVSKLMFDFLSQIEDDINLSVKRGVTNRVLASNVNFAQVIAELKRPMESEKFLKVIPEIQEWYIQNVNKIEQKAREQHLLD